jgi:hypothetical protein
MHAFFAWLFPASIVLDLLLIVAGKSNTFASEVALLGYREMTHGKFKNHYWWGGIALGHIIPFLLLFVFSPLAPVAVVCSVVGLFFYEYAFVMAPQHIPNS